MTTTADQAVELDGFRFAMIPEAMIYSDLSGTAIKVFGALLRHGVDPARCYPSHKRLAKLCRLSINTIKRSISELEASGWVTVVHRRCPAGGQASNGYRLHDSTTPQPIDELPPQPIDELPPSPPVGYEREQENESNLNESTTTTDSNSKSGSETAGGGGPGTPTAIHYEALTALGYRSRPEPEPGELRTIELALKRGHDADALIALAWRPTIQQATTPRRALVGAWGNLAARQPEQPARQPIDHAAIEAKLGLT